MDWLTHTFTAIVGALAAFLPTYVWFKKQMQTVASAQAELNTKVDATATAAWQSLFNRCEAERTVQDAKIERLCAQVASLIRENADLSAQVKILEAKVARLEQPAHNPEVR
jgi:outer membrane murein-binding lipoprotein Lpp